MRRSVTGLVLLVLALAPPTVAQAGAPLASTGSATAVNDTSATLNGTVGPNKEATNYYFEYGTTTAYGLASPTVSAGSGNATKDATSAIAGLAASTTYHFRLVAVNPSGTAYGADMSFTTLAPGQVVPTPTLTFTASPLTVLFGASTTLKATLTNFASNAGQSVELRENPYPYSTGFKAVATALTDANGVAAFVRMPALHTQYQAVAKQPGNDVTGAVIQLNVRPKISLGLSDRTPRKGQKVRFKGSVTPAHDGRVVYIQKRGRTGGYKTIGQTTLKTVTGGARSSYSKTLKIYSSGKYRALLKSHEDHLAATKIRSLKIH